MPRPRPQQASLTDSTPETQNAYDHVPYVSYCYAQCNLDTLAATAALLNHPALDLTTARVLEIGCASGWNILPLAARYPRAEFVGVDYSTSQIDDALANTKKLGLSNIKFIAASIADCYKTLGHFDVILCHGVYSWVKPDIQDAILATCEECLTENGIAYISYNTLPGWNMVKSIRDVMLYHSSRFSDPKDKASQSRMLLQFLIEATTNTQNAYTQILQNELKTLEKQPDSYLLHDHLEDTNDPIYFHEFANRLTQHNLHYIGDTNLSVMYAGNLKPEAAAKLSSANDHIRVEQYLDYIHGRRFRCSIIARGLTSPSREISASTLDTLLFTSKCIVPDGFEKYSYKAKESIHFSSNGGYELTTSDPVVIFMLKRMHLQHHKPINLKALTAEVFDELVKAKLPLAADAKQQLQATIAKHLLRLAFMGSIGLHIEETSCITTIKSAPKAWGVARACAMQGWVPNLWHEPVAIATFEGHLLALLDGTRDEKKLLSNMLELFSAGTLTVDQDGQKITDISIIEGHVKKMIPNTLQKFARHGLLIA